MTKSQQPGSLETDFFTSNPEPSGLKEVSKKLLEFLEFHKTAGTLQSKKIALVTSGGTTVPLESNTVRFIDNFSAGTRGSLSTEYFLNNGYLVIFLYREFLLLPFLNHFGNVNFLDLLKLDNGKISLNKSSVQKLDRQKNLYKILQNYEYHKENNNYLMIPFTTINEYLFYLRAISHDLKDFFGEQDSKVLIYLAAAVSDFFIPHSELPEHKIQSSLMNQSVGTADSQKESIEISSSTNGKLRLSLDPVPKFLKTIVDNWYNNSFVISFKLETDSNLLIRKCKQALEKYDHQLVIGNLLQTRKKEVVFVENGENGEFSENWYRLQSEDGQIELFFIPEVIKMHEKWIKRGKPT